MPQMRSVRLYHMASSSFHSSAYQLTAGLTMISMNYYDWAKLHAAVTRQTDGQHKIYVAYHFAVLMMYHISERPGNYSLLKQCHPWTWPRHLQ